MANSDERHPIVAGLVALVSVTAAVGAIVAVAVIVAAHALGGGSNNTSSANDGASMVVPLPKPTPSETGALVTLPGQPTSSASASPTAHASSSPTAHHSKPAATINLTASVVSAGAMQQFTISGTYPGGEGHMLRLQRKNPGGAWADFGIPDMDVQGGQFSTPVQTGHTGVNAFRVKDVDTGKLSNTVKVTID